MPTALATLLAVVAAASVTGVAREAHASHPAVANDIGDWAVKDTIGRLQVLPSGGGWLLAGAPGGGIAGGIAAVQTGYDYRAFFVTTWDGRVRQYARVNGAWSWTDHGQPPCGPSYGAPTAAASGNYVGVLVRCQNGALAELYRSWGTWAWTHHGSPSGTTVRSDPAMVSTTWYTGALMIGADGNVWERYYDGGWWWANHGNPGIALVGHPGFVRNPYTNYTGGLFVTAQGTLVEDYYDFGAGRWRFTHHTQTSNPGSGWCTADTGAHVQPSFTTETGSPSVMGVVRCANPRYALRLRFEAGWHWDLLESPASTFEYNPFVIARGTSYFLHALQYTATHIRQLYLYEWSRMTHQGTWWVGPAI